MSYITIILERKRKKEREGGREGKRENISVLGNFQSTERKSPGKETGRRPVSRARMIRTFIEFKVVQNFIQVDRELLHDDAATRAVRSRFRRVNSPEAFSSRSPVAAHAIPLIYINVLHNHKT